MAKPKSGFWKANQGFSTTFEGDELFVQKGELVRDGHPLLKGREELFDPAEKVSRFDHRDVEQATAAPGEKRGKPARKRRASRSTGKTRGTARSVVAAEPAHGLSTKDIQPGSTRSPAE